MNFFRLRIINTLLLFFIGVVLGFILKEKFYPAAPQVTQAEYKPAAPEQPAPAPAADDEELTDEPYSPPEEPERRPERSVPPARPEVIVPEPAEQAVIEAPAERPGNRAVLKGEEANFFANPGQYEGRDLELDLQMITARRLKGGWRLNLVYSGAARKIDYLYVDDAGILGEKPDLRIGYVYKVRFSCARGLTDSGNTLAALSPTGGKADWATGLSAIE